MYLLTWRSLFRLVNGGGFRIILNLRCLGLLTFLCNYFGKNCKSESGCSNVRVAVWFLNCRMTWILFQCLFGTDSFVWGFTLGRWWIYPFRGLGWAQKRKLNFLFSCVEIIILFILSVKTLSWHWFWPELFSYNLSLLSWCPGRQNCVYPFISCMLRLFRLDDSDLLCGNMLNRLNLLDGLFDLTIIMLPNCSTTICSPRISQLFLNALWLIIHGLKCLLRD